MPISPSKENFSVVILCGGKGTRLQAAVSDCPKAMAEVAGKPFLDWLIEYVAGFGFRRFVLCTGYLAESIESHYACPADPSLEILFSRERVPLGTGGAVKKALLSHCQGTGSVVVLNGDTFCQIDFDRFIMFHNHHEATVSIAVSVLATGKDHGQISLGPDGMISSFSEKTDLKGDQYASAGVYLMQKNVVDLMPSDSAFSLEFDLFPGLARKSGCYGYVLDSSFHDIGTPERYAHVRNKGF